MLEINCFGYDVSDEKNSIYSGEFSIVIKNLKGKTIDLVFLNPERNEERCIKLEKEEFIMAHEINKFFDVKMDVISDTHKIDNKESFYVDVDTTRRSKIYWAYDDIKLEFSLGDYLGTSLLQAIEKIKEYTIKG